MKSYVRISEYMWLMLAITCAGFSFYEFAIVKHNENGMYAIGFTVLASAMYALRRSFRRKVEKHARETDQKEQ